MRRKPTAAEPFTIAHRAGNELHLLREACEAGVDLIEADVRYHRGRIEVRHLKTMGPVPVLWDRWRLARGWTPRFLLEDLLAVAPADCELMLDVKGGAGHFPGEVVRTVRRLMPGRLYTVCSQYWNLLEPFHEEPEARVVHSIGSARMLREVLPRLAPERCDAVSIHKKLLSPAVVADLLARVDLVMTWPVNTAPELRRLQAWGVNGFISDSLPLLREVVAERAANTAGKLRSTG
ncbi:MAG: glycerophosphodiester phosphodiesterase [Dehalococcoidia bacterium]|nr:glycerophosphodiester phosphodiesterase [Dehalococcoidia bacterium]